MRWRRASEAHWRTARRSERRSWAGLCLLGRACRGRTGQETTQRGSRDRDTPVRDARPCRRCRCRNPSKVQVVASLAPRRTRCLQGCGTAWAVVWGQRRGVGPNCSSPADRPPELGVGTSPGMTWPASANCERSRPRSSGGRPTWKVRLSAEPSGQVPMTVNGWVPPGGSVALAGVMAMDGDVACPPPQASTSTEPRTSLRTPRSLVGHDTGRCTGRRQGGAAGGRPRSCRGDRPPRPAPRTREPAEARAGSGSAQSTASICAYSC